MLFLYKSYVRSKLEYGCPVWHNTKFADIQLVESLQRTFTSKVISMQNFDYWQRLKKLKIQSLQRRRERYIIFLTWKIVNGLVTNDLGLQFQYSNRRGITAVIRPLVNSYSRVQTLHDNSFAVLASKIWNVLPAEITIITTFSCFKQAVDNFLGEIPDKPPIAGYPYVNNNSLASL